MKNTSKLIWKHISSVVRETAIVISIDSISLAIQSSITINWVFWGKGGLKPVMVKGASLGRTLGKSW